MSHAEKERFRGKRLLILDSYVEELREHAETMRAKGFEVITWRADLNPHLNGCDGVVPDRYEFMRRLQTIGFDAVLTSRYFRIPGLGGYEVIDNVGEVKPGVPVIIHSDFGPAFSKEKLCDANAKERGGIGAFSRGSYTQIADAFAAAFAERVRQP